MSHPLRIAFLSDHDPNDRKATSGTLHFMARALEAHVGEVAPLGPLKPPVYLAEKALARAAPLLTGKR